MEAEDGPVTGRQFQDPQLLTPPQVCQLLQVKLDRIYELVWARRLRAIRIGRQLRFRPRDIEAFLERSLTG
jgi:excisionase family DNA binding protein